MKKNLMLVLMSLVAVLMMSSCNKVPQVEMDAANSAFNEAKASGAEQYLPAKYAQTMDSLNAVMVTIESKKSKLFAGYKNEKVKLENVKVMSAQLKTDTEVRKSEVKAEVEAALTELQTVQDENKVLLTEAPKGKEGAAALEAIKEEINMLDASIADVSKLLAAGKYLEAQTKVKATMEKAMGINTELKDAIAKTSKHKRK
jgi:hypothetical protein